MTRDPRDKGVRGQKEWEEFRASYGSARVFAWLIGELDEIAPGYADDLRRRINEGISMGELLADEDPQYDGAAIIHSPVRKSATFIDHDDALLLEDQLFPHPGGTDQRDFTQTLRGMAIVAFHSALESYALAIGVSSDRKPLPQRIGRFLATKGPKLELSASRADTLTVLDELRHLIVHSRGIVNERYRGNVKYTTLEIGELRAISAEDLETLADTSYAVALRLAVATKMFPPSA